MTQESTHRPEPGRRTAAEPGRNQPGGEPAKNQPGGEPAKNQPGGEPARNRPGGEPAAGGADHPAPGPVKRTDTPDPADRD
ncbi:hypothetical protein KBP30_08450 [Streptomyces sp. Go40/10]|uniref:hypothetical protein n=1 Tax=Streptomyces sp. Go40/10 TaxID=2825844 RepID=UPI001E31C620|nr:hypothetical protein [Streptomyces sp. Go40/10]UFR01206.1 hypothetical protein KBP30_08450 [Streptomyces sp. Go40/10]